MSIFPADVELMTSSPWRHVETKMEGSRESWPSGSKPVWSPEMCGLVQHIHSGLAGDLALIHTGDSSAGISTYGCGHWRSKRTASRIFGQQNFFSLMSNVNSC